jgi:hypothetical protein
VRTEEEKAAFLSKRSEFRTAINRLAEAQCASKAEFRSTRKEMREVAKSDPHPENAALDRHNELNLARNGILHTRFHLRHFLLAYAMFRGKPYLVVEQKTNEPVKPYDIWCRFRQLGLHEEISKHQIELWLGGASATAAEEPRGLEAVA